MRRCLPPKRVMTTMQKAREAEPSFGREHRDMTAQQIFEEAVASLPNSERLKLAALILQGLVDWTKDPSYSDEWTEQDMREWTEHTMRYAEIAYPEPEDATN